MKKYLKIFLIAISPLLAVITFLYLAAITSGFEGSSGGQQDAFRHTFASALTAKIVSPKAVELVTIICERDDNNPLDLMDRHNNKIGASIGMKNESIFSLYGEVKTAIQNGQVDSKDENVITWLPKDQWKVGI